MKKSTVNEKCTRTGHIQAECWFLSTMDVHAASIGEAHFIIIYILNYNSGKLMDVKLCCMDTARYFRIFVNILDLKQADEALVRIQ